MGCLGRPLLSGIDLYHTRDVERVYARERVGSYQDYARVCVDFFLRISKANGLQDWREKQSVSKGISIGSVTKGYRGARVPAGSLR